tara:strand:- start:130 stop:366 length:237 start_codon:yes stop_codon:yes gene_type:complete
LVFPFWEEEEVEEEDLVLHDFERSKDFVDENFLVSKERRSVFTAFMDDDISFVRLKVVRGNILTFGGDDTFYLSLITR